MFVMIDLMKNKEDLIDERKFKLFANPFGDEKAWSTCDVKI